MARDIKWIVFHCTASGHGNDTPESVTAVHLAGTNHWKKDGYHYLVTKDGKVHYMVPESESSNGVKDFNNWVGKGSNSNSINICYTGGDGGTHKGGITHVVDNGVNKGTKVILFCDTRNDAQKRALRQLAAEMKAKYPKAKIIGHYQVSPDGKTCPCFNAQKEYSNVTPATKINNYGTPINYHRSGDKVLDNSGKQVGTVVYVGKVKGKDDKVYNKYKLNWGKVSKSTGTKQSTQTTKKTQPKNKNSSKVGVIPGYGDPTKNPAGYKGIERNYKDWLIKHRNRWKNYLIHAGVSASKADNLSVFFMAQDGIESTYGTSDAAIKKNNFGGMQSNGKNITYKSFEAYAAAKYVSLKNRFEYAFKADNVGDYVRIIGDPHRKYGYYVATNYGKYWGKQTNINLQYEEMYRYVRLTEAAAKAAGLSSYVKPSKYIVGGNLVDGNYSDDYSSESGVTPDIEGNSASLTVCESQEEQICEVIEATGKMLKEYPDTVIETANQTYETYKTIVETVSKTQVKIPIPELPNPLDIPNKMITGFRQAAQDFSTEVENIYEGLIVVPDGIDISDDVGGGNGNQEVHPIIQILLDCISPATDFIKEAPSLINESLLGIKTTVSGTLDNFVQLGKLIVNKDDLSPEIADPTDPLQIEITKLEEQEEAIQDISDGSDKKKVSLGQVLNVAGTVATNLAPTALGMAENTVNGIAQAGVEVASDIVGLGLGAAGAALEIVTEKIPAAIPKITAYVMKTYVFGPLNKLLSAAKDAANTSKDAATDAVNDFTDELTNIDTTEIENQLVNDALGNTGDKPFVGPLQAEENIGDAENNYEFNLSDFENSGNSENEEVVQASINEILDENDIPTIASPNLITSPVSDSINNIYQDDFKAAIGNVEDEQIENYENFISENESSDNQVESNTESDTEKSEEDYTSDDVLKLVSADNILSSINSAAAEAESMAKAAVEENKSNSDTPHIKSVEDEEKIESVIKENSPTVVSFENEFKQLFEGKEIEISVKLYTEIRKSFLEIMPELQGNDTDKDFVNMASFAALKMTPAMIEYINNKFEVFEEKINMLITQTIEEKLSAMGPTTGSTEITE